MAIVPIRATRQGDRPPADPTLSAPPEVYTLMAAAQMHSEGRLIADESEPYKVTDPDEMAKWDETLGEHGAIQMGAPSKGQPWKDFFDSKEMQQYLNQNKIERKDLKDGGVILRKKAAGPEYTS